MKKIADGQSPPERLLFLPEIQDMLRKLSEDEFEAMASQIELERRVRNALIVTSRGMDFIDAGVIVDGHHRQDIAINLQLKKVPWESYYFESWEELVAFVKREQGGRRNMSKEELKLMMGREFNAKKKPAHRPEKKLPQNEGVIESGGETAEKIAEKHGVSRATVERAGMRAELIDSLDASARKTIESGKSVSDMELSTLSKCSIADQEKISREVRTGQNDWTGAIVHVTGKKPKPATSPRANSSPAKTKPKTFRDEIKVLADTIVNVRKRLDQVFGDHDKDDKQRMRVMSCLDTDQMEMRKWK